MTVPSEAAPRRCLQRLAQGAFWFFLIKGLLWVCVPVALTWFGWQWGAG
jgi:hypothetical protein